MSINYHDCVAVNQKSFVKVTIPQEKLDKISEFIPNVIRAKMNEQDHMVDHRNEEKRWMTGLMGEAALEVLLGIDIIDWRIGNSSKFNNPDIPGYGIGIKTVETGKFPIIYKRNNYPQIICIKDKNSTNTVWVCGLATPAVLNRYQSDELILNPQIREKGYKTGFYGFGELQSVESIDDLAQYRKRR